jgi:hypothetical protein
MVRGRGKRIWAKKGAGGQGYNTTQNQQQMTSFVDGQGRMRAPRAAAGAGRATAGQGRGRQAAMLAQLTALARSDASHKAQNNFKVSSFL